MNGLTPRSLARWQSLTRDQRIAEMKAERKAYLDHEAVHHLYRCYEKHTDALLYIGCTMDVEARIQVHLSSWSNPASAYLILHMGRYEEDPTPYVGRIAGRAAEKAAIEAEAPYLNQHHNKGRGAQRVKVEPLTPEQLEEIDTRISDFLSGGAA